MPEKENLNLDMLELFYFKIVDLWKRFCELHSQLYDLTCDEYSCLLSSELDKLEMALKEKDGVMAKINIVESIRQEVIQEINLNVGEENKIKNVTELIKFMEKFEQNKNSNLLQKMNSLLIEIIESIQKQNKKNQIFLNKAVLNLSELKQELSGSKSLDLYSAKGMLKADVTK